MIKLGDYNTLRIVRFTDHGCYLDGGDVGEILMPKAYVRPEMHPGDEVTVFVYLDQSERLVGTHEEPLAKVGDFAYLRCSWVNDYGAFLDWGLMKDLFVPFAEQKVPMKIGQSYYVHIHIDPRTHRIVASSKTERYIRRTSEERRLDFADTLLEELRKAPQEGPLHAGEQKGFLPFSDNSTPDAILQRFHVSKKVFKRAVGTLYRAKKITLCPDGIALKQ